MIKPEDVEFHAVPEAHRESWAETNYFPFWIPEVGISGAAYTVFRPGLGVCLSDITIFDHCAFSWEGLAYTDNQQHIPCPASLSHYSLRNGLEVKVLNAPRDYRIDYLGIDDTELHFTFHGLMRPQDFNDPDQDPLARRKGLGGAWDKAFAGHFDMTGKVDGALKLRGVTHRFTCLATMDHSWGPRLERDNGSAVFIQAHFGDDLSVNALMALDPSDMSRFGPVLHGYVMRSGNVRALVAGEGRTERSSLRPDRFALTVEDEDGAHFALSGHFETWAPWAPYVSVLYYQGMVQWLHDGRIGTGAFQEVVSRASIARFTLARQGIIGRSI
ncbi:DUF7065 domain-containing protein [Sphingosinicella soli]|uniref:Uncharacterized protein n=1 Tax=Sphingosinicella soli TaxID=333708 RepID=A0A7W7B547_9SPHN|nr:hypothetical protein [Sphingosinicella soli]MBB4633300.1 hypothetical protein [Sphingosinicella soli]